MWEIRPVHTLCTLPASDLNFRSELEEASSENIKEAIEIMKKSGRQHKGRILACEREMRRRERYGL